ncbi:PadR family transcriptional regulator [Geotoga petraea]|jgi:DNA-binding PadR family transcriptional regulator|uniref:PadR family transcriptional regulator n=1 Tax=Geotoga petraea TaxID=28234 RepID=A0A4Z0VV07_9BACT|nr:PadR family transcriptional regulator [Geotoga petraea]TGG87911.1 PadR family transcriptional regulator [Geotoga petraea]
MPRGRGKGFRGKGWLMNAYILLIIAEEPCHGYKISEKLLDYGVDLPGLSNKGRIYRILSDLESNDLVEFDWDTTSSPPKKIYKITSLGEKYLEKIKKEMLDFKSNIDKFIDKMDELYG